MSHHAPIHITWQKLLAGFIAAALAVLFFHQMVIFLLNLGGYIPFKAWSNRPIAPYGVPAILNQMFWGGLWGCLFSIIHNKFPHNWHILVKGIVFGILPALFGWIVMAYIRSQPMFAGFEAGRLFIGLIINCVFGFGIAFFLPYITRSIHS